MKYMKRLLATTMCMMVMTAMTACGNDTMNSATYSDDEMDKSKDDMYDGDNMMDDIKDGVDDVIDDTENVLDDIGNDIDDGVGDVLHGEGDMDRDADGDYAEEGIPRDDTTDLDTDM